MSEILRKAKEVIKAQKKEKLSPMDALMKDPEVKEAARLLAKEMPLSKAREELNRILEEAGRLPTMNNGKLRKFTYARFKELLPKSRKRDKSEL